MVVGINRSIGSLDNSTNRIIDYFILSQLMILSIELLMEVLVVSEVVLGAGIFGKR